jgi:hypothetical protein
VRGGKLNGKKLSGEASLEHNTLQQDHFDPVILMLNVPPNSLCVKGLVPMVVLQGGSGTFKRWGLLGGPEVIRGTLAPPLLSFASWPQDEQLYSTTHSPP